MLVKIVVGRMIHDIILSCLNLHSKQLPIEEFLISDAVDKFFHPCERKLLEEIIKIINLLREVAKFSKTYGTNQITHFNVDEPLQNGLYLKAFANGLENVLDEYLFDITELESRYLQNPSQSIMFLYQKLQEYEPLALYLNKLIRGIRVQKMHGCAIIQYLQKNSLHGDARISKAVKAIQLSVNVVFLKQLTHWILYAKIVDSYGEFFIQCAENHCASNDDSERGTNTGSGRNAVTSISELASNYTDIWRYEICYELLPHYLSSSWAEKILFIGQTVLIFQVDANKLNKNAQIWNKSESKCASQEQSLWDGKEHFYFAKIQALQNDSELNISHYERVVDEIKSYVTSRLSEIAVNQADLMQQLKLIKDFYLLGRGELFLEFIRQTYIINKDADNENKLRDFVNAFESAAHGVGVSEDLEQFSLCIPRSPFDADEPLEFGYLQLVQLQYKINWPLHLLFSPKVLERYNMLFKFLLLVKKMQYELHMLWCHNTRESKLKKDKNIRVMHLRNELMFFVDNLQYYIQVDVLESQFSILQSTILNKADFEQIQRSHSIFQANILSLCFLLTDENTTRASMLQSSSLNLNNPVYLIINEIFHICEEFCALVDAESADVEFNSKIDQLNERFGNLIQQLINLLDALKAASCTTPLSQLLLRLDFNHWFSIKKEKIL